MKRYCLSVVNLQDQATDIEAMLNFKADQGWRLAGGPFKIGDPAYGTQDAFLWERDSGSIKAEAEALRAAGVKIAAHRHGATGRKAANADLFGHMVYAMGDELEYQHERTNGGVA